MLFPFQPPVSRNFPSSIPPQIPSVFFFFSQKKLIEQTQNKIFIVTFSRRIDFFFFFFDNDYIPCQFIEVNRDVSKYISRNKILLKIH